MLYTNTIIPTVQYPSMLCTVHIVPPLFVVYVGASEPMELEHYVSPHVPPPVTVRPQTI